MQGNFTECWSHGQLGCNCQCFGFCLLHVPIYLAPTPITQLVFNSNPWKSTCTIIMNTWTLGWVLAQGKFVTTGPGYSEFRVSNKLVRLYFLIQFWSVLSDRRGVVLKLPGMEVEGRTCKMFLALSYTSSQARGDNPRIFSFHYKEKRSRPSPLCWPISFSSLGIYAWR